MRAILIALCLLAASGAANAKSVKMVETFSDYTIRVIRR